jgi:hypothetical protein
MVLDIFSQILMSSIKLVIELTLIITGVMLIVEVLQEYKILHHLTSLLNPVTSLLKLPRAANLPLLAGICVGISFGAAIIIDSSENGSLNDKEIYLINLFLVICHSLIEDTIVWMALGAYAIPVQIARIITALIICYCYSQYLNRKNPRSSISSSRLEQRNISE